MDYGSWLTAVRVARLPTVLRVINAQRPPGLPVLRASLVIWKRCGGLLDEVPQLVEILVRANLVVERQGHLVLTKAGRHVATQDHQQNGRLLAIRLIRAGFFAGQARRLVEMSEINPVEHALRCRKSLVQEIAPQLSGLLRRWPDVVLDSHLHVPMALAEELTDVWALLPARDMIVEDTRQALGDRAEAYSYRLERLNAADATKVRWVAQDNNTLGYDIENLNSDPPTRIEVKGSTTKDLRFFLSSNEWRVAQELEESYQVQFWGGMDLSRPPDQEFELLRREGYPIQLSNIAALVRRGELEITVQRYLVALPSADEDSRSQGDEHPV